MRPSAGRVSPPVLGNSLAFAPLTFASPPLPEPPLPELPPPELLLEELPLPELLLPELLLPESLFLELPLPEPPLSGNEMLAERVLSSSSFTRPKSFITFMGSPGIAKPRYASGPSLPVP